MGWLKRTFGSSVGTKLLVALTGLGLVGFLVAHMTGNLLIYVDDGKAINAYAKGLHELPGFQLMEIGLIACFVAHIVLTIRLSLANRAAKGGGYAVSATKKPTGVVALLASKTMALSGLVVLVFLVVHIADFRLARTDEGPMDLIFDTLQNPLHASLYAVGSLLVSWHVSHGFQSAFRSLGFNHTDVTPMLVKLGSGLAILLGIGFASIPVWIAFFR